MAIRPVFIVVEGRAGSHRPRLGPSVMLLEYECECECSTAVYSIVVVWYTVVYIQGEKEEGMVICHYRRRRRGEAFFFAWYLLLARSRTHMPSYIFSIFYSLFSVFCFPFCNLLFCICCLLMPTSIPSYPVSPYISHIPHISPIYITSQYTYVCYIYGILPTGLLPFLPQYPPLPSLQSRWWVSRLLFQWFQWLNY